MILPDEIQSVAQEIGQKLGQTSAVTEYLQSAQAVQNDSEAGVMEQKLLALYQQLSAKERSGQEIDQSELKEYYQLREKVWSNPLVAAREDQLQLVKYNFVDVGQALKSLLGIDFSDFAR